MSTREKREYEFDVVTRVVQRVTITAYSEKDARAGIKAADGDYDDPDEDSRIISIKRAKDVTP